MDYRMPHDLRMPKDLRMTNQPTPRLVPDWVRSHTERMWDAPSEYVALEMRPPHTDDGPEVLHAAFFLEPKQVAQILPALAFFAEHGRLPTHDDQPKEAQGDE